MSQLMPTVPPSWSALWNIAFPSAMNFAVSASAIIRWRGVDRS